MGEHKPRCTRILRLTRSLEDTILILLLAAMVSLAVTQIVMRNGFETGISWGDPLLRILVLWVGLCGAIVATREDNHISINILARLLPPWAKLASHIFADLFAASICGILAYHCARFVASEFEYNSIAFGSIPSWVCQLILPISFGIMAVRFLALAASRKLDPPHDGRES